MTRRYGTIARAAVKNAVTVRHKLVGEKLGKLRFGTEKAILYSVHWKKIRLIPPSGYMYIDSEP